VPLFRSLDEINSVLPVQKDQFGTRNSRAVKGRYRGVDLRAYPERRSAGRRGCPVSALRLSVVGDSFSAPFSVSWEVFGGGFLLQRLVQVSRWRGRLALACPRRLIGSLTTVPTSTSMVAISPGAKGPGGTSSPPPKPTSSAGVNKHRSVSQ
jgi:hypothetical protein